MRTEGVDTQRFIRKCHGISIGRSSFAWWTLFGLIIVLSFGTRFYKVTEPDHVCWDETHFGKMASWYINRTFFFDVHPPLGKMLIALAGHLTGYNGSFAFEKPGDKYEDTNYVGMRMLCTFLGACLPPLGFLIVWELTYSDLSAFLASYFLVTDVSLVTISQYILLDPILLFFEMFAFYAVSKFFRLKNRPFTKAWWTWLFLTGAMLACSVSVKFVGLFMVIHVGILTAFQLWKMIQKPHYSLTYIMKHFLARCMGLILLPVFLYTFFFYIHLSVLNKSGNGDGFYSSAFQSQLLGNSLHNASMPREVAFGALVTLKNHRTGGGYLHSHWHLYPEGVGARQQQITTYTHKDDNNKWVIKPYYKSEDNDSVRLVKNGDLVVLEHLTTARNLHSHKEPAPISKKHFQVTGYGENGTGDANDVWKIQIVGGRESDVINTVTTQIRFLHSIQHCTLTSSGKQLPKWAYEQQEVSCNPNLRDKNGIWNVEDNIFDKLPNVSFEVYGPTFLERIIESHAVMLQGNAGLKPKEGEVTSRPWQWPLNYRGQFFSGNSYRIYLLGNPIIWWPNLIFLVLFLGFFSITWVHAKRGYVTSFHEGHLNRKLEGSSWLFLAWVLHYFPFWAMGRVLYYHHYFPALLFNTMLSGIMISFLFDLLAKYNVRGPAFVHNIFHLTFGFILSIVTLSFIMFSPLSYGMAGPHASDPNSTMYGLKWLETWEF